MKYTLSKKISLIFTITIIFYFPLFLNAQNQCVNLFTKEDALDSGVKVLIDQGSDFVMTDFVGQALPLRSTGCGPVCAINVVEAVRLQLGLAPRPSNELSDIIYQQTKSQMIPSGFGTHFVKTSTGLNVGSLAKLLDRLLKTSEASVDYNIKSFYVEVGRSDLASEGNIQFVKSFGAETFFVGSSASKILLVSVNDKSRLSTGNSFLTAHFYNVLSYKDGIVTLHDPNIKGSQIQFRAISDTDASIGITSYRLEPITPNYTIDPRFPKDLLYILSGYVSLDIH